MINFLKKFIPKKALHGYHFITAYLAALFYGFPSNKMIVVGITGTAGKTSSVYLMAQALSKAGYKTGYTSTAMFSDGDSERLNDKKMSMLGGFFTQKMLKKMHDNDCVYAVIETTSEGIRQFRHRFINYDIACFTGLYPEHIESHGSFENYREAKGKFFSHLKRCSSKYVNSSEKIVKIKNGLSEVDLRKVKKTIIINGNDEHSEFFSNFWSEEKIFYYVGERKSNGGGDKSIMCYDIRATLDGLFFKLNVDYGKNEQLEKGEERDVFLSLLGEINILNSLPVISLSVNREISLDMIVESLGSMKSIPGRMEIIDEGQKFLAVVDYAYEPVALSKLYETIDLLRRDRGEGRTVQVLGSAGGGRDKSRRFVLGEMAARKFDYVIVSDEDPYDEDPWSIINQVASGAESAGKKDGENLFKILDRREAIAKAVSLVGGSNDMVLLTGKGCEQAICIANNKKKSWDDRAVLREEIAKINKI